MKIAGMTIKEYLIDRVKDYFSPLIWFLKLLKNFKKQNKTNLPAHTINIIDVDIVKVLMNKSYYKRYEEMHSNKTLSNHHIRANTIKVISQYEVSLLVRRKNAKF